MKIILVYAGISDLGFNSLGLPGMDSNWINHGLCSISAYAKEHGFGVSLIDLRRLRNWVHFKEEIKRIYPGVVGFTMCSVDYDPIMKCIDIIKSVNDKIVIIVGGPHPSILTDEVASNQKIDYIIVGEGEISFTKLLQNIRDGKKSSRIINGKLSDLDNLPFVDRELFGYEESPVTGFESPFVTIIAGRGCMYNCSFCQPAERMIFGKAVRRRIPSNVIEELKILRGKCKFKTLMIHDDCLTEDRKWVVEFCRLYKENNFNAKIICQSRADIICRNEDMIKLMAETGLKMLLIGFESGNQRVLNFMRKGTTIENNFKAAEICRRYGIKIWANYMMGMPTETKEEIMDTVRMIRKMKPDVRSPAFYTPHPGSDMYRYCVENKLSLIKSHGEYRRNPYGEKIKGVDYNFLRKARDESLEISLKERLVRDVWNSGMCKSLLKIIWKSQALQNFIKKEFL